ncbi:MAG TPA: SDR family oxidoreductase [Pseudorhodoferax sp.]|nr:SDR family oxidoreductase [Pseudorhodoferax sp.]
MTASASSLPLQPTTARLQGRVVLVTGAGSGIGRAAALGFARAGATVALAGRRKARLDEVSRDIAAASGTAESFSVDLADAAAAAQLPGDVLARFGRLDAAFNNAGTASFVPLEQVSAQAFDHVMATNVRAVLLLIQQEVAAMRAGGHSGAIVNTSSIAASGGLAGMAIYAASKGALDAMIGSIALEVGRHGIRINNIRPGIIRTPLLEQVPPEALPAFAAHAALQRVGDPEDVADAAVWLCSDEARFVTGQSLTVDGGFNIAGLR